MHVCHFVKTCSVCCANVACCAVSPKLRGAENCPHFQLHVQHTTWLYAAPAVFTACCLLLLPATAAATATAAAATAAATAAAATAAAA